MNEARKMTSKDKLCRLAGLLYLIMAVTTAFSLLYVIGRFVVAGDAAATLAHIQAHRTLFEFGIVAGAVGFVDYLILGLVLYRLFSPVGKSAASLMLAFIAAESR